jgi:hypothetical protein
MFLTSPIYKPAPLHVPDGFLTLSMALLSCSLLQEGPRVTSWGERWRQLYWDPGLGCW